MILGLRWYGPVAVIAFVAATILMVREVDPFYHDYYMFAWYCYIFLADSIVYRFRGHSLISNRFGEFLLMLPLSFAVWEMFEGFDLRLENWHYEKIVDGKLVLLPHSPWNYPKYFIAFATVLPGEFETLDLIRIWAERRKNWLHSVSMPLWVLTSRKFVAFQLLGWACIALPMAWPRLFFPLIWLSMFLLVDPINWRAGRPSILREMARGNAALFWQILLAGVICGGCWELWNFWAGTKWIYTVPWPFNQLKVFEMPLLGYFGFPPFALECYALYHFLRDLPGIRRLAGGPSRFAYGDVAVEAGPA